MVMKLIAHGQDRPAAIERLQAALSDLRIGGITHNVPYLQAVLRHPAFGEGKLHTGFLGDLHAELLA